MDAQARVGLTGALRPDARGDDRLAIRRGLRDLAHREVAVDRQCERARDRSRRHVQHVRRAVLGERGSLLDAEPMLLVDDRDGEIGELDVALDQRMCADGDLRDAVRDLVADLLRSDRTREQHAPHPELRAERFQRQEVLLRERLRRRHQRALPARLHGPQKRIQGDDGLAGADVALQQALHRRRLGQIEIDLGDRALLMLGQLERQHPAVAGDQLARAGRGRAPRRRCRAAAPRSAGASRARRAQDAAEPARPGASSTGKWIAASASRRSASSSSAGSGSGKLRASCASAVRTSSRSRSKGSARWPDRRARSRPSGAPRRCHSSSRRSRSGRACRAVAGSSPQPASRRATAG